ncbi:hypothetical protein [Litorimonas haliclonae]|uniref:hypothetical protein n=1 Tax=Litorimonas haliclonae TaxID=2081977 RepID=UPI0039EE5045
MKVTIERSGVFDAKGKEVAVGTEMDVKGDEMPAWLIGKASAPKGKGKPAKSAETDPVRKARYDELVKGLSEDDFTKDGEPNLTALNQLLDEGETPFTAKDRKAFSA